MRHVVQRFMGFVRNHGITESRCADSVMRRRRCSAENLAPQNMRAAVFKLGSLALVGAIGLSMGACQETSEEPPPAHVDDQGREIIPCSGDLCFDLESPATRDAHDRLVETFIPADAPPSEYEWVQEMIDSFAACNYQAKADGLVVVECPTWVTHRGCPPSFFLPTTKDVTLAANGTRHYCVSDPVPSGVSCRVDLACPGGGVCAGEVTRAWDAVPSEGVSRCIPADDCLRIAAAEGIMPDARTCFYSDFTVPQTGLPDEQDCGTLAEGTCSINCPCDPVAHPVIETQVIDRCLFVSEERPVGVCASRAPCVDGSTCLISGSVCAGIAVPAWVQEYADTKRPAETPSPSAYWKGYCVMRDACEAWAAKNPGVVTSGCSDVALEPPTVGGP